MRVDPATYDRFFQAFVGIILVFFAFVGVKIALFEHRRRNPAPPPPKKPPTPGGTGEYRDRDETFGTSGIGASDMAPAGIPSTSTDLGSSDTSGSDTSGGDTGGGGDFSGGGGESGGGGASGGW